MVQYIGLNGVDVDITCPFVRTVERECLSGQPLTSASGELFVFAWHNADIPGTQLSSSPRTQVTEAGLYVCAYQPTAAALAARLDEKNDLCFRSFQAEVIVNTFKSK